MSYYILWLNLYFLSLIIDRSDRMDHKEKDIDCLFLETDHTDRMDHNE